MDIFDSLLSETEDDPLSESDRQLFDRARADDNEELAMIVVRRRPKDLSEGESLLKWLAIVEDFEHR